MSSEPQAGRVMVVEDEQLIRWSIRKGLERLGHAVCPVESGEECLQRIAEFEPDVLILDIRLPGIDGIEVLKRVRRERPDARAIMLSAHGTVELAVEAMKIGAVDFLTKPFDIGELARTVENAVRSRNMEREVTELSAGEGSNHQLIGDGVAMEALRDVIGKVARSEATTVLILGESGSGKEVVARNIHFSSRRASAPFMTINCTSLPEHLVESELLGHEKGAFTDAKAQKRGLFEVADGGSVLLDEIGDMPLGAQAKLLRVLEEKRFKRVGGTTDLEVDIRMIAATHRPLDDMVRDGTFRQDLFFRLNIVTIDVPPLRDHTEDLPALTAHMIASFNRQFDRSVRGFTPDALQLLESYAWPGNVRELRGLLEWAFVYEARDEIGLEHLPSRLRQASAPLPEVAGDDKRLHLNEVEAKMIRRALEETMGNQTQAAKRLGISRDTLRYRMKKYGLK